LALSAKGLVVKVLCMVSSVVILFHHPSRALPSLCPSVGRISVNFNAIVLLPGD
jgi:hypothetical protein